MQHLQHERRVEQLKEEPAVTGDGGALSNN